MRRNDELHLALRAGRLKRDHAVKIPLKPKGKARLRNGVGKTPAPYRSVPKLQEVVVQVSYANNDGQSNWGAHGKYLAREGAQQEDEFGLGFDPNRDDRDMAETLTHWQQSGDERFFKVMISAEHGSEIDLKEHTRRVTTDMEKDLGTKLQWVAIDHYNTDNPHVHLSIRGVNDKGGELYIDRQYLTQGIRQRAREAATRQLGLRTEQDLTRSRERLIDAERFTTIDRVILKKAGDDNTITYDNKIPESPRAQENRIQEMGRLQTLAAMGLAEKTGPKTWQLSPDTEKSLRQLQRSKDIIKSRAHEHTLNQRRQFAGRVDEIERWNNVRPQLARN